MQVKGVNHVNIIADDLDLTAKFYADLLGFRRGNSPGASMGFKGAWLLDGEDQPIIHLMGYNEQYHAGRERSATGSIDHVALSCEGFTDMKQHFTKLGVDFRVNDREFAGLRQIFVTDPNNVKLELNFGDD